MILACNESPKLSPSSEGEGDKQVSSCELLKMLRKGKHRRFLFENKYLKPVTVKYENEHNIKIQDRSKCSTGLTQMSSEKMNLN